MLIREKLEEAIMRLEIGDFDPEMPGDVLEAAMNAAEGEPKLLRKLVELQNRYAGEKPDDAKKLIGELQNLVRDGPPALATVSESAMAVPEPARLGMRIEDGVTEEASSTRFWAKTPVPEPRIAAPMMLPDEDTEDPDTEDSQIKNPQEMAAIVREALSRGRTLAASVHSPAENDIFRSGMTVKNPPSQKRGEELFAGMVITEPPPVREVKEVPKPPPPVIPERSPLPNSVPAPAPLAPIELDPPGLGTNEQVTVVPAPHVRRAEPEPKPKTEDDLEREFFRQGRHRAPNRPSHAPAAFVEHGEKRSPVWVDAGKIVLGFVVVTVFMLTVDALLPESMSQTAAVDDSRFCEEAPTADDPATCEIEEGLPTCDLPDSESATDRSIVREAIPPEAVAVETAPAQLPTPSPARAIVKKAPPNGKPLDCRNAILQGEAGFVKFRGKLWHLSGVQIGKNALCTLTQGEHAGDVVRTGCFDQNTMNDDWCPVATILSEG